MLFFFSAASALFGNTDLMVFFAIMGMLFSSRSWQFFTIPLILGMLEQPEMAVVMCVAVWIAELALSLRRKSHRQEIDRAHAIFCENPTAENARALSEKANRIR